MVLVPPPSTLLMKVGKKRREKNEKNEKNNQTKMKLTAIRVAGRYASAMRLATLMVLESLRAFCVMQSIDLDSPDAADAKSFREKTFS